MKKNSWYKSLESAHRNFLSDAILNNNAQSITEWINDNIVNNNSNTDTQSKGAFYDAVKSLMRDSILRKQYEHVEALSDSIDGEKFKNETKYQTLTYNQCIVIADAIKMSKESLEKNDNMHKALCVLLKNKYSKLTDKNLKDGVSTLIEEALQIVSFVDHSQQK